MVDENIVKDLLNCFPGSFVNDRNEFIADVKTNSYFILENCESEEDVQAKCLEWLSRPAYKGMPYRADWRNDKFHKKMQDGINDFLETNFTHEEFGEIYQHLGNCVNHQLTLEFIHSGYDFSVFLPAKEEDL